ncbi:hypothetical protein [Kaarinaea lacus]
MKKNRWLISSQLVSVAMGVLWLALTSCSYVVVTDPTSPYYIPSPGSKVVIHQRLEVPPGRNDVFFQHGKVISRKELNQYNVNCNLNTNSLEDITRYVEPGTYTVTRTTREENSIVQRQTIRLASLSLSIGVGMDGGGPSMMFEIVKMRLQGEPGANVTELVCRGGLDDPSNMQMPSLAEIRQALGKYVSIEVPEEAKK